MARKLPWASSAMQTTLKPQSKLSAMSPATRSAKRPRIEPTSPIPDKLKREIKADISSSDLGPPTPSPGRRRGRELQRRRNGRTPSTSPPPAPPPIDFMHEGLDADDVYVMVEDEFHAMAQSFTAHLHHAEYKRLVREARERRTNRVPDLPANASFDVRTKQQRRRLEEKQISGLNNLATGLLASDEDEDIDEQDVAAQAEKQAADPWAGTTLAGLMNWDPAASKTSLKGIQKLTSDTRAAQGYAPNVDGTNEHRLARLANDQPPRTTALEARAQSLPNKNHIQIKQEHEPQSAIRKGKEPLTRTEGTAADGSSKERSKKRSYLNSIDEYSPGANSLRPGNGADTHRRDRSDVRSTQSGRSQRELPQKKSVLDSLEGF